MPVKSLLDKIELTRPENLETLVENRRIFNLDHCELNVFESYQEVYRVPLTFPDFVITSMVRGKKIMHLFDQTPFDYLPGETVIVPANETMVIDFPIAQELDPSQCIALAVDAQYVNNTLEYLNGYYGGDTQDNHEWKLQFNHYHFENDSEVTNIINKLVRVCSGGDTAKNIFADLGIKELLIRLLQNQHLQQVAIDSQADANSNRLHYVLHYIQHNLTEKFHVDVLSRKAYMSRNMFFKWFKEQFGVTPLEYVNKERIKLARQLLATHHHSSITSISQQCGFTDVNYFVRMFKKMEGITPGKYRESSIVNREA